jgi:hypothetical protein
MCQGIGHRPRLCSSHCPVHTRFPHSTSFDWTVQLLRSKKDKHVAAKSFIDAQQYGTLWANKPATKRRNHQLLFSRLLAHISLLTCAIQALVSSTINHSKYIPPFLSFASLPLHHPEKEIFPGDSSCPGIEFLTNAMTFNSLILFFLGGQVTCLAESVKCSLAVESLDSTTEFQVVVSPPQDTLSPRLVTTI